MENKVVSLENLIKIVDNVGLSEKYVKYLCGLKSDCNYRHQEILDIKSLLTNLKIGSEDMNGFIYGYVVPQLNKEFDLLKITLNSCVNIEIKSQSVSLERIEKQLLQNQHFIKMLNKQSMFLFTYIADNGKLYKLENDRILECDLDILRNILKGLESIEIDLDEVFTPKNILVSPLNSPKKFLSNKYLLTENQTNIKNKIMDYLKTKELERFVGITGGPGTGKTLLIYDLAKELENNYKVLLVHSGYLCDGHRYLNEKFKNINIISVKDLNKQDLTCFDIMIIDESHRLYNNDFDIIQRWTKEYKKIAIFSYDTNQKLSNSECRREISPKIESLCGENIYVLKNKIRTNKEILSKTKTKPSMVITDPKGELYIKHANSLQEQGYKVEVIDLADVYHSTQWNPFNDVWKKTEWMTEEIEQKMGKYFYGGKTYLTNEEAEQAKKERKIRLKDEIYVDLQDLMYTACPVENKQDATWQKGARDLLLSLALAFWEDVRDGYMDKTQFNLYNLYRNVTDYAKDPCSELKAYFNTRDKTSRTRGLSNTVLVTEDRTLTSFLGDVNQYLNWMADGGIATLTSGNEIEFSEFDENPTVLFLKIPDEKENRHKLVSLMITQMYKALVEKATRNQEMGRTDSQKLLRNIYFIMDEFGNLPKLYKMDSIVTVGRSRGIFMMPVIQGFKQLDDKYGREVASTIRSNCNIQIFIGTNEEETCKIFSEQCGKKKVKQVSYSENKDMSVSTSAQSVPIIYPSELERLNDPKNGKIGNSIVLCLGCYPIKSRISPAYKVKELYGMSDCLEKKKAFIDFDENKNHYDIVHVTQFLQVDKELKEQARKEKTQPFEQQQVQQVEQVQPVGQVGQAVDDREVAIKKEKERIAKEILNQIKSRISMLKGKLGDGDIDLLNSIGVKDKIYALDGFAEQTANAGNFLLSSEIENIKSFILFRCFEEDEIEEIEKECEKRRMIL